MLSRTLRCGNSAYPWKTMATGRRSGASRVASVPSRWTVPCCGRTRPATTRSSVDFPLPDGPTTASTSPGATCRLTPSSAGAGEPG